MKERKLGYATLKGQERSVSSEHANFRRDAPCDVVDHGVPAHVRIKVET